MKKLTLAVATVLLLAGTRSWAQGLPPDGPGERPPGRRALLAGNAWAQNLAPGADRGVRERRVELVRALEEIFFPPELVMRHQRAIGLRDDQQETIRADLQKSVARFTDLQWQESALAETIEALCRKQPVDEKAVLAQVDKLLSVEGEIKRLRLASLIRVKNVLTPEQQEQLRGLERQTRPGGQLRRPGGDRDPGGAPPPEAPAR